MTYEPLRLCTNEQYYDYVTYVNISESLL